MLYWRRFFKEAGRGVLGGACVSKRTQNYTAKQTNSAPFHTNSTPPCPPPTPKAKEAIGAIARLEAINGGTDGGAGAPTAPLTINVEYNQLDPLLRATVAPGGDEDDPATGARRTALLCCAAFALLGVFMFCVVFCVLHCILCCCQHNQHQHQHHSPHSFAPTKTPAAAPPLITKPQKKGLSPYPGNINQLVLRLAPYAKVLERTGARPPLVWWEGAATKMHADSKQHAHPYPNNTTKQPPNHQKTKQNKRRRHLRIHQP
jgi:hypothetical protein